MQASLGGMMFNFRKTVITPPARINIIFFITIIDYLIPEMAMAKSDSFFIRAKVGSNGATYVEQGIDLGSFVNLGVKTSTLLRIHNIAVQYADASGADKPIYAVTDTPARVSWQLTTQSQSEMLFADDKSLISSGALQMFGDSTSTAYAIGNGDTIDLNPQEWSNGYLVGVDEMFLAVDMVGTVASGDLFVSVVIECTLENATQANATALALSQQ